MAVIYGNSYAPDYLEGTRYSDLIQGFGGNDAIFGYSGNDSILGGYGNDYIDGGEGYDRLFGDAGYDVIFGGNGNDSIDGGANADRLYGGCGNDTIKGGEGNDLLDGYSGNDIFAGGQGSDDYTGFSRYTGHDTITDCNFFSVQTGNLTSIGGDDIYLNTFVSDSVAFRILDTNHDGSIDALKICLSPWSDITIWNYFAGAEELRAGIDSNFEFHFADTILDYHDVLSNLGNLPV